MSDASQVSLDDIRAKLLELHKPYSIYTECDHDHYEEPSEAAVDVEDIGLTCAKLYDICRECCTDGENQTERCADSHQHGPDVPICKTVEVLNG